MPAHMRAGVREVVNLQCKPELRKRGYATTLMHLVCRQADEFEKVLLLYPKAFADGEVMADTQLMDWYCRSFGFAPIQKDPVLLARMVGATPKMSLQLNPTVEALVIGRLGQPNV